MAHWTEAAVTNDGIAMLNEWMAGRKISITGACGGSGWVKAEALPEQKKLVNQKQRLKVVGEIDSEAGKTVQIQIHNAGVKEEYPLQQIGVLAKLDADKDPDAEEKILFIMQDPGSTVTVPAETEPSFLLELYCLVGITNNGRFEVSVDSTGLVTIGRLQEILKQRIAEHNADVNAHQLIEDRILRMFMLGAVFLPMADQQGRELCTRDGTVIAAVKKI